MALPALITKMLSSGPVLTDGAWGTQLQARGLALGECPDRWNLDHPDRVLEVARAYVRAGSRVILSNTFGGTRWRLAEAGLADRCAEINETGVRLSRQAAETAPGDKGRALVFGSIGPTGKTLLSGGVTPEGLAAAFTEQAAALARGDADALVVETMYDLQEAAIAVRAARATGLPVVACMVFDSGSTMDRTLTGITPEQAAAGLIAAGADAIGSNCGRGIAGFVPICRRLQAAAAGHPVWIKANAGLPVLRNGKPVYTATPAEFASHIPALVDAGADFVGGCCGTSPDFISAAGEALRRLSPG
jgi:5-methyltetrahydrofolate--homocysteine methyltransferase